MTRARAEAKTLPAAPFELMKKAFRVAWTGGCLLAAVVLLSACATEQQPASCSRWSVGEHKENTFWWDLLGWLAYPTAQANAERESHR